MLRQFPIQSFAQAIRSLCIDFAELAMLAVFISFIAVVSSALAGA